MVIVKIFFKIWIQLQLLPIFFALFLFLFLKISLLDPDPQPWLAGDTLGGFGEGKHTGTCGKTGLNLNWTHWHCCLLTPRLFVTVISTSSAPSFDTGVDWPLILFVVVFVWPPIPVISLFSAPSSDTGVGWPLILLSSLCDCYFSFQCSELADCPWSPDPWRLPAEGKTRRIVLRAPLSEQPPFSSLSLFSVQDSDSEFWSNLDPDPGLCYQFGKNKLKVNTKRHFLFFLNFRKKWHWKNFFS